MPAETIAYGPHPDQVGDLWRVPGATVTVVTIHGGFWLDPYRRDLMDALAADLAARGATVWNIEYRRVDGDGGWPATFLDVAAAVDHVAELGLDPSDVTVMGHSAGGQLACWSAARWRLPAGAPGAGPRVRPRLAVGIAGVADLAAASALRVGGPAVVGLLGGLPHEVPDRYALASPVELVPIGVPLVLVHGADDSLVDPAGSVALADAEAAAGGTATVDVVPATDHFDPLRPTHPSWARVVAHLADAGVLR